MPPPSTTSSQKSFKRLPALSKSGRPFSAGSSVQLLSCRQEKLHVRQRYHGLSTPGWCQAGQDKALVTAVGTAPHFSVTAYDNLCHCQRVFILLFQGKA